MADLDKTTIVHNVSNTAATRKISYPQKEGSKKQEENTNKDKKNKRDIQIMDEDKNIISKEEENIGRKIDIRG